MTDERHPRIQDLPPDWEPGDSGFSLHDSDIEPPTLEELRAARESDDDEPDTDE